MNLCQIVDLYELQVATQGRSHETEAGRSGKEQQKNVDICIDLWIHSSLWKE